ncbi:LysR family transcriptional regulator [Lysobacter sp. P5_B9]
MDRLEAMTILLAAVDTGSLSAASRQLGIPLATVSRRVAELEEHLKVRLLLRGSRKLTLTDSGAQYITMCRRIIEDIAEAERTATGEYRAPQGDLLISAPTVMGKALALPVIVDFLGTYPDIRIRVQLSDRTVNLVDEHVDLALRLGELPDSSLVATRVGLIREVLCASPAYLKLRGTPKEPVDLLSHDCITYEGTNIMARNDWNFLVKGVPQTVAVRSRLVVNSAEAAVIAAVAGGGIARVLSYQIVDQMKAHSLVQLLDGYEPAPWSANLIYPSQRQVPLKLRAFLDFSVPRLRHLLGYKV